MNAALLRSTGYELRKPSTAAAARRRRRPRPGDRLVTAPAFILCSVRSGSTLLRVLLNSHSQIHSPHELHLRDMTVQVTSRHAPKALGEVGLEPRLLEYLLWDRVLHRELESTGKSILVNKTPSDVFVVDRILECWPDARFLFLLRHPVSIARSRHRARPQDSEARNHEMVRRYCAAVQAAREAHPGLSVRYEDLAADPKEQTQRICRWLGVRWEPRMLDYGEFDHGRFKPGLGDWTEKIKSGRVQPPAPLPAPEDVPEALRGVAAAWDYLPLDAQQTASPKA